MSTIRCPMCGKENDDQAERCNFCQAALKSFNISETPAEPSSGDDWLSSLRSETAPEEEPSIEKESPAEAEQTENEEAPDWLQRIRQRNAEENGNAVTREQSELEPDQKNQEEEGIPSWLRGLEETPVETGETGGEETPQQPDTEIPANLPEEEIPQAEEGDWLSSLREPVQAETIPASDEFQTFSEELTEEKAMPEGEEGEDFLKNLAAWQSSQAEVEEGKTEVTSPVIEESDHPQEQTFSEDMPAFRQPESFSQESTDSYNPDAQKLSEEDEQPEWLKSLQQIAGVPESVDIPAGEGDLPDWLQDLDQSASAAQESSELAEIESVTESDFSDRIQEISESTENAAFDSEDIAEVQAFDTSAEPVIAEEFQATAPDSPDAGFFTTQDSTEIPAAEEASEPEWLSNLREAAPGDLPESPSPFNEDELPEWLNGAPEPLPDENAVLLPDFQTDQADSKLSDSDAVKIGDSELPDWLSQIPQTEAAATGQELPILSEEISPAELPTWLKAMKPSEPRSASFTDASVFQQTGPLAGLPEILPSTESKLDFPASVLHTGKLLITESQQQSADIISTMLDKIGEAATVKPVGKSITRRWMRPVIAVLLLVVIVIPLILGLKTAGNVSTLPVAGEAVYAILESLADESPVLIAFEYEPAFSGELTLAGSAILQQLAIKQSNLVFVSTTPAGPILADTLLQSSLDDLAIRYGEDDVSYLLDNRVVNLGYLAGSTTSLQEFARNPRQAARNGLKAALDGVPTWSHPALSNIDSLDDFALVIVLTDSSETGRAWVEQVEPNLADTPLVMVTSSLAAPMLQPYYQSAQIDGLLAGIRDGSSYQSKLFSNGIGNSRSAALQFAVILVSLIIFIGMMIFGIQAVLVNRRKE